MYFELRALRDNKMGKILESIGAVFFVILWLVGLAGWGYGVYHAFDKHSTAFGVINVILPPIAVFYTAPEGLFFHDDGIDWEIRMDNDVSTGIMLMNASMNFKLPLDKIQERNNAIELYINRLKTYPPDKRKELKTAVKIYRDLFVSTHSDLVNYSRHLFKVQKPLAENSVFSQKTTELRNKLKKYKSTYGGVLKFQYENNKKFVQEMNAKYKTIKNKNIGANIEKGKQVITKMFSLVNTLHLRQKLVIDAFLKSLDTKLLVSD